jgi:hypothetical protein
MRLLLASLVALVAAPTAAAEVVFSSRVDDAGLAVAANGSPRAAYVRAGSLSVAARTASGWEAGTAVMLPGTNAVIVGVAATAAATYVLAEGGEGEWLRLVRLSAGAPTALLRVRARARHDLGPAGLVVDRRGRAVVAWAEQAAGGSTTLRLWRERSRTVQITRGGFPPSDVTPPVAPLVMRDGSIRVVEAYAVATEAAVIEWRRSGRKWVGQYVFASALGAPAGVLRAAASGSATYAAWTHRYPSLGETNVVVARNAHGGQTSATIATHAILVDLAPTRGGFEAGANDWVDGPAFDPIDAALVVTSAGTTQELDGTLLGYAIHGATRHFLVERDGDLEWFSAPSLPSAVVHASVARVADGVAVTGSVTGATAGPVAVYRERPNESRVLVGTTTPAPDGSFTVVDATPVLPAAYRAVYKTPMGVPVAHLVREIVN